uniref:BolA-like protein n=1 Tax=Paulinella longichromatophora TaxID=1708747 RepID=A0A2H4ZQ76_9EUKA|nr:BolA-like protein [Paulinella longichromatophora]
MISPKQIYQTVYTLIPDSIIEVEDLTGNGDHISVKVISSAFIGLSRVKQHQLVYRALEKELADEAVHALVLNTVTA